MEGERSGRPRRLSAKQMEAIGRVVRNKPSDAGMRVNLWDGCQRRCKNPHNAG